MIILGIHIFHLYFRSPHEWKSLDLIFQMLLEDKDSGSWQYTMGKLLALDHLLTKSSGPEGKNQTLKYLYFTQSVI